MVADRKSLTRRLKIIRGQVDGILSMVEEERYCIDISTQLMAVISALKSVNKEVLSAHLEHCVHDAMLSGNRDQANEKLAEISNIITKLAK